MISAEPARSEVLAKVLVLRPDRIAAMSEAALVADADGVRTTAAWLAAVAVVRTSAH